MTKLKAVFLRRWPILLATTLIGAIAGFASASVGVERGLTIYEAEQVIVANRLAGNPANVAQDALKVSRGAVPERAAEILGEPDEVGRLARKVRARPQVDSNSIELITDDTDPEAASARVQAFTEAFLEVVNDELRSDTNAQLQKLRDRLEEANANLEAFDEQYGFISGPGPLPPTPETDALVAERGRLMQALSGAQAQLDDAELRTSQREPYTTLGPEAPKVGDSQLLEVPESPLFRAGLLGLIGLLLGVGLVMIVERVNQRIDTRDELAELISVPILAELGRIPARSRPGTEEGRLSLDGVWSEHYRRVRSAIHFVQADAEAKATRSGEDTGPGGMSPGGASAVIAGHRAQTGAIPRVFLFASALPGEGKSTSVALTAMALAETGTETLVINADFRRPMVENYLGAARRPSLADRAELNVDRPEIDEVAQPTDYDHLWVAASGPPTHEVGGRLEAARELAAEAAARGGTVLIDSSPLRVSNDPIDLLASVDEVILIVRAGRTTVKSIEDTMELLDMHHAPTLGVILIGTFSNREMYAYYQSYYSLAEAADAEQAGRGDAPVEHVGLNGASLNGAAPNGEGPHVPEYVPTDNGQHTEVIPAGAVVPRPPAPAPVMPPPAPSAPPPAAPAPPPFRPGPPAPPPFPGN